MHPTRVPSLLLVCAALSAVACEREHEAAPAVRSFLDAVQYGDRDGAFALHIDSTPVGGWCTSQFTNALKKAQSTADSDECERVLGLDEEELDALPDELRLAVQITGWACANRDGTCQDYARTVFEQSWAAQLPPSKQPEAYTVRRVFGEGDQAVAYVDFQLADGKKEHRTIELTRVDGTWRVSDGFLKGPQ